jgi:hypothetical protein
MLRLRGARRVAWEWRESVVLPPNPASVCDALQGPESSCYYGSAGEGSTSVGSLLPPFNGRTIPVLAPLPVPMVPAAVEADAIVAALYFWSASLGTWKQATMTSHAHCYAHLYASRLCLPVHPLHHAVGGRGMRYHDLVVAGRRSETSVVGGLRA